MHPGSAHNALSENAECLQFRYSLSWQWKASVDASWQHTRILIHNLQAPVLSCCLTQYLAQNLQKLSTSVSVKEDPIESSHGDYEEEIQTPVKKLLIPGLACACTLHAHVLFMTCSQRAPVPSHLLHDAVKHMAVWPMAQIMHQPCTKQASYNTPAQLPYTTA